MHNCRKLGTDLAYFNPSCKYLQLPGGIFPVLSYLEITKSTPCGDAFMLKKHTIIIFLTLLYSDCRNTFCQTNPIQAEECKAEQSFMVQHKAITKNIRFSCVAHELKMLISVFFTVWLERWLLFSKRLILFMFLTFSKKKWVRF